MSERVSEAKFPASWENTGNFARRAPRRWLSDQIATALSMSCEVIPYASEQGIYFGLTGNQIAASENLSAGSGKSRAGRGFHLKNLF